MPKLESFTLKYAEKRTRNYQVVEASAEVTFTLNPGETIEKVRPSVKNLLKRAVRADLGASLDEVCDEEAQYRGK